MNRYIIDGSLMTVERRETTHSLLRSAGDRTRWIANELLEHLCPDDALQLRAGFAVAVLWENGNPDATTRSKFDLVIE